MQNCWSIFFDILKYVFRVEGAYAPGSQIELLLNFCQVRCKQYEFWWGNFIQIQVGFYFDHLNFGDILTIYPIILNIINMCA
jgi:hypothetical protein